VDDEWPPREDRVRAAQWEAEGFLGRREYFAAGQALARVFGIAGEAEARVRGLHHLAAAGYKAQTGDERRARRQLEHARRRLAGFPADRPLIDGVAADVESAGGELAQP
jgi:hypothetical protein